MAAESALEKKIVAHAKTLGCMSFKFTSPSTRGVPDRVFILNGRCLFLEIKALGKRPNLLQLQMISKLRKQGVPAAWVDNFARASCMLADFFHSPDTFNEIYS